MILPRIALVVLGPLSILLLPLGVYWADRATSEDHVARNVSIAGIPVGGLTESDALVTVEAYEQELRQSTGVFTVNDTTFKLSPVTVELSAATTEAVSDAMEVRRDGGMFANFWSWIASFGTSEDVDLPLAFSDEAIEAELEAWEQSAIPNPAFDGALEVTDGEVVVDYPRAGEKIDRLTAQRMIVDEMSTLDKNGATLPVIESTPNFTRADVESAAAVLELMIDSDITLTAKDISFRATFTADQLAEAARAEVDAQNSEITLSFDEATVLGMLEPRQSEFELAPVDAQFDIDVSTDRITVVPGSNGTLLDVEGLLVSMKNAALGGGEGVFPLLVGAEPAFTTEDAEAYTALELLASFRTTYTSGEDRVTNIQQMAQDVDGAVVQPGREWSINDAVGQRTEAKGYVAAPAIINGQPYCCDHPANIGGGVSQFGTTLFNAVFYACLEDVEHRPHSLSFSRYPEGIEATLGYPHPDVRFRNNTDAPVVIKTTYSSTTVTVKIYGDNGGKECSAETSEREDIVEFEEELIADTEGELVPGQRVKERSGIDGFLVRVNRVVTYPDGREDIDLRLTWRYAPLTEQYLVHPCEASGEPVNCPIQLPSVAGLSWQAALETLQEIGMLAARSDVTVDEESQNDIVQGQDPASGTWAPAGSTVTLQVGVYSDGSSGGGGGGDDG
ncbi:MAG: VanW family protein [Acidimicrobiia bacterium]|nr:VanW family protein [Acidimicrobiia bacterium]